MTMGWTRCQSEVRVVAGRLEVVVTMGVEVVVVVVQVSGGCWLRWEGDTLGCGTCWGFLTMGIWGLLLFEVRLGEG